MCGGATPPCPWTRRAAPPSQWFRTRSRQWRRLRWHMRRPRRFPWSARFRRHLPSCTQGNRWLNKRTPCMRVRWTPSNSSKCSCRRRKSLCRLAGSDMRTSLVTCGTLTQMAIHTGLFHRESPLSGPLDHSGRAPLPEWSSWEEPLFPSGPSGPLCIVLAPTRRTSLSLYLPLFISQNRDVFRGAGV